MGLGIGFTSVVQTTAQNGLYEPVARVCGTTGASAANTGQIELIDHFGETVGELRDCGFSLGSHGLHMVLPGWHNVLQELAVLLH